MNKKNRSSLFRRHINRQRNDFEKIAIEGFGEFGIELTANTYSAWKGMPLQKIELAILHEFGTDFPITTFKNRFQSEWQEHLDHNGIDTMPGIKALLEQLAWEKVKISVATSTPRDKALQSLKLADLNIPQGRVIGGDMVENGKPFPDIFVKAANSMKCNPHQLSLWKTLSLEWKEQKSKNDYNFYVISKK